MKKKLARIPNPLVIGKVLGDFNVDKNGPRIHIDLKTNEEKAERITKVLGVPLTGEEVALFTFLHELGHYLQWKQSRVTTKDLRDTSFRDTPIAKQLEVDADNYAMEFIKDAFNLRQGSGITSSLPRNHNSNWTKRTLLAMIGAEKTITLERARDLGIIS